MDIKNEQVTNLIKNIFKEANKQSSNVDDNYKICALRCLADAMQFSSNHFNDADFELYWTSFIEKYFEESIQKLNEIELKKQQQLQEQEQKNAEQGGETKAAAIETDTSDTINPTTSDTESSEQIKKLKLNDDEKEKGKENKQIAKDADDEANNSLHNNLRTVCLETFGKCWPHSNELQGRLHYLYFIHAHFSSFKSFIINFKKNILK